MLAIPILFPLNQPQLALHSKVPDPPPLADVVSLKFVSYDPPAPPDYETIKKTSDEKLEAKRVADEAAKQAEAAAIAAAPPDPPAPVTAATPAPLQAAPISTTPDLVGALGYAHAGGNCVQEPGVNNPGWGNPIDWPITTTTPSIGASALFTYNHVAVVTGLWSNGDIEVRHQNWNGAAVTRFPRSTFRGYR